MPIDHLPPVPSVARYVDALRQLEASIHPNHKKLLQAHYAAPDQTMTARELAAAVGYPNHHSVNLQYGQLGERLRELMAYRGDGQASYVFAAFVPPRVAGNEEWLWVMHENVARALEQLGWV